jgi:phosphatidylserine decarboxylase
MPTRPMDPGVKRARAEGKEFLRKMAGFSNGCRDYHRDRSPDRVTMSAYGSFEGKFVTIGVDVDVAEFGGKART